MIAFVFPGQGSQKRGMGQGLFDEVREFTAVEQDVDSIVGYSLRQMCLEDAENKLKETKYTQPCLYVVNALFYYKALREGARPDYLAGHSLGEYNALMAAGVFDFITGLRLVKKRGELMSQARNGSMGAVIGMSESQIVRILADNDLGTIDLANFNTSTQIIVSGPADEIKRAGPLLEKGGARMFMPLQVSAAFHSRYMVDAAKSFAEFLAPMLFHAPRVPVIANVNAQRYPTECASEGVKVRLSQQIKGTVLWNQSVRLLLEKGVTQFNEMGPSNVLTRLCQQIQQEAGALSNA